MPVSVEDRAAESESANTVELQEDVAGWALGLAARLARVPGGGAPPAGPMGVSAAGQAADLDAEIAAAWGRVEARLAAAAAQGIDLPVERLRGDLDLSSAELSLLLALWAPEVEPAVARAYRAAATATGRRGGDVAFGLELLGASAAARDELRSLLAADRTLRREQLLVLGPAASGGGELPFLQRPLRVANRVADALRGVDGLDEGLAGLCLRAPAQRTFADLLLPKGFAEHLRSLLALRGRNATAPPVVLLGPPGAGKRSLAEALAHQLGCAFLSARVDALFEAQVPMEASLALLRRELLLGAGVLYLEGGAGLPRELSPARAQRVLGLLGQLGGQVFLGLAAVPTWMQGGLQSATSLRIPPLSTELRSRLWERALPKALLRGSALDLAELGQRYALTPGAIEEAAAAASMRARRRSPGAAVLNASDLDAAARAQVAHKLGGLAVPILPRFGWRELVLPEDELQRLRAIVTYVRNQARVFEDWGLGGKGLEGRGIAALFAGPEGTGKRMAAAVLAQELGLELLHADLGRVLDRGVAESERNLARLFGEVAERQALLLLTGVEFFDTRGRGRAAERYGPQEASALLQQIEDAEGLCLLSSTADEPFDEAIRRRIRFHVSFPLPDESARLRLWRAAFPKSAGVARDVDWRKLARSFEMSGGRVRSAALRAAFLAAEAGGEGGIDEELLMDAARAEYLEMGKLVRE